MRWPKQHRLTRSPTAVPGADAWLLGMTRKKVVRFGGCYLTCRRRTGRRVPNLGDEQHVEAAGAARKVGNAGCERLRTHRSCLEDVGCCWRWFTVWTVRTYSSELGWRTTWYGTDEQRAHIIAGSSESVVQYDKVFNFPPAPRFGRSEHPVDQAARRELHAELDLLRDAGPDEPLPPRQFHGPVMVVDNDEALRASRGNARGD